VRTLAIVLAVLNPPEWLMPTVALLGPLAAILLTIATGKRGTPQQ
jgi:hypothetical protein